MVEALSKKYGSLPTVSYADAGHGRRAKAAVETTKTDLIGATL